MKDFIFVFFVFFVFFLNLKKIGIGEIIVVYLCRLKTLWFVMWRDISIIIITFIYYIW